MHLILTGATGLVGSGVLDGMLKMKDVTKISILSRKPVRMAEDAKDPRVNVIIHQDFTKYDSAVLNQLQGARGCVWALGISQTQVNKEEYVKITKDYALAASEAFQTLIPETNKEPFRFVYVSGAGATTEPGRFSAIYARVKGETELALAEQRKQNPLLHTSSVRPAGVDGGQHAAIQPYLPVPPLSYRIMATVLLPPIRYGLPSQHSPTFELGRFLTGMAMGKYDSATSSPAKDISMIGDFPIVENSAFKRLYEMASKQ